jgi:hypothetical protein
VPQRGRLGRTSAANRFPFFLVAVPICLAVTSDGMKRLVVLVVLLVACQSDEAKLTTLRSDATMACLGTTPSGAEMKAYQLNGQKKPSQAMVDSVRFESEIKCQLAQRALNRFLEGR